MKLKIQNDEQSVLCEMSGRLDTATSMEIIAEIQELVDLAHKKIVVDCSELTFVSSSGLRQFLTLRKATIAKGGSVLLKSLQAEVKQVFAITGFMSLFEIED